MAPAKKSAPKTTQATQAKKATAANDEAAAGDPRRGTRLEEEIGGWFAAHVDATWFTGPPRVLLDRDELLVLGALPAADDEHVAIAEFRDRTRDERIAVALRAEALFGRKVSWAAQCGDTQQVFTHLSVPVMTRLRIDERRILDTLVAAGVARSRSDALAWCVRLVGEHEGDWIQELRDALEAVERVRAKRG